MFSLLVIIFITFVMLGLPNVLGSAWPVMYGQLGVSGASAGIISMLLSGSTIVGALLCDKMIQRFGAGKLTLVSLVVTGGSLVGFSFSGSFILLCLWAIPLGFGLGFIDAAMNNVVALHYEAKHMNWLHAFWGVGASIGPMIMAFFLARGDLWQAGYRSIGAIHLFFVVIFLLTFKLWRTIKPPVSETDTTKTATLSTKQLLAIPGVKQSLFIFLFYCAIEATVGLWASSYLVVIRNLAEETAAFWLSLYFIGITIGRFMAGFLTTKLNNKQLILLGCGMIGAGIVILFLPVPEPFLLVSLFLIGFGCAPIFPSLIHETPTNFGKANSQAIIGIQMAFAYMGSMLMPPLFGYLAELTNFYLFPFYLGGFLVLMVLMIKWLYRRVADCGKVSLSSKK